MSAGIAGGTTHYVIAYRKANDSAPSKIATISSRSIQNMKIKILLKAFKHLFCFGYSSKLKFDPKQSNTVSASRLRKKYRLRQATSSQKNQAMTIIMNNDGDFDDTVIDCCMASSIETLKHHELKGLSLWKYNKTLQGHGYDKVKEISVKFSHEEADRQVIKPF